MVDRVSAWRMQDSAITASAKAISFSVLRDQICRRCVGLRRIEWFVETVTCQGGTVDPGGQVAVLVLHKRMDAEGCRKEAREAQEAEDGRQKTGRKS